MISEEPESGYACNPAWHAREPIGPSATRSCISWAHPARASRIAPSHSGSRRAGSGAAFTSPPWPSWSARSPRPSPRAGYASACASSVGRRR